MRGIAMLASLVMMALTRPVMGEERVLMETSFEANDPEGWTSSERRAGSDQRIIRLLFAVKNTNLQKLESELVAVSDPDSPRYGQHLTNEEVHQLTAPTRDHLQAVIDHVEKYGLKTVSLTPSSDILAVDATISQAEALLSAEYFEFTHSVSGETVMRTRSYALPAEVADAVDFVSPTVHLPPARKEKSAVVPPMDQVFAPQIGNSPKRLRELYSIDVEGKAPDNSMAVTAFLNQHYSKASLHEFWTLYCSGITCGKGDPDTKGDSVTGITSGVEAMLDIESITGVAGNVSSAFWGFSGNSPDNKANEPFMSWLALVSNTSDADVPKLFSTSYGENENSWSMEAATRLNTEFQKAGARGISLLFASGDSGANCQDGALQPNAPASSPWVTAVGGVGGSKPGEEFGIGLSSGGFSNRWAMPSWQKEAVEAYLKDSKDFPSGKYNSTGRGYPDISAQGQDFTVVSDLVPIPGVAGTSCAAPTASGVIALLNDARLQAGKPTLGFLNIWIYKNMDAWNDIVKGASSGGCDGIEGWPAESGWDAVSGVGTPNYKELVKTL
eukprot:g1636.t1